MLVENLLRKYSSRKRSSEKDLSYISWALYWSVTELNTKGQVSAVLPHISRVL